MKVALIAHENAEYMLLLRLWKMCVHCYFCSNHFLVCCVFLGFRVPLFPGLFYLFLDLQSLTLLLDLLDSVQLDVNHKYGEAWRSSQSL